MILWKPIGKMITLTFAPTPRHGKNWREMMDERCEEDNAEYDRSLMVMIIVINDNAEYDRLLNVDDDYFDDNDKA